LGSRRRRRSDITGLRGWASASQPSPRLILCSLPKLAPHWLVIAWPIDEVAMLWFACRAW
jgi:hypothetical protein